MKKFEAGKTYSARSACDYDCVFSFKVLKRTEKSITIESDNGDVSRKGVKPDGAKQEEICFPRGNYSMAPLLRATRQAA